MSLTDSLDRWHRASLVEDIDASDRGGGLQGERVRSGMPHSSGSVAPLSSIFFSFVQFSFILSLTRVAFLRGNRCICHLSFSVQSRARWPAHQCRTMGCGEVRPLASGLLPFSKYSSLRYGNGSCRYPSTPLSTAQYSEAYRYGWVSISVTPISVQRGRHHAACLRLERDRHAPGRVVEPFMRSVSLACLSSGGVISNYQVRVQSIKYDV
jgi:hypothetical protein